MLEEQKIESEKYSVIGVLEEVSTRNRKPKGGRGQPSFFRGRGQENLH